MFMHTYINTEIHVHTHAYILSHNTCIFIHTYTHIHTYIDTYINRYIHTHTHSYIATVGSPSVRVLSSDRIYSAQKAVDVAAISVNSTSKFRDVFEATTYFGGCDSNIGWITGRCFVVT
jgi:hypothetical protein